MFDKKDASRGRPTQTSASSGSDRADASTDPARSRSGGTAVIGRSIKIDGTLSGDEDLRVEGYVSGTIRLPNHCLAISKEGRLKADVYSKSMMIEGEVSGDLIGSESVSIRAAAKIRGNVLAARVSLEEGANFKGSIDMDPKSIERALVKREIKRVASDPGGVGARQTRNTDKGQVSSHGNRRGAASRRRQETLNQGRHTDTEPVQAHDATQHPAARRCRIPGP